VATPRVLTLPLMSACQVTTEVSLTVALWQALTDNYRRGLKHPNPHCPQGHPRRPNKEGLKRWTY